jgi:uncharacterized protein YuzE
MQVVYNDKTDLLYLRFDERRQPVVNERVAEDIVLDRGKDNTIVGIEILNASKHLPLAHLLPIDYGIVTDSA